ncbi:MAG: heparan-alpha-glucosaminide N-acetyltransferase domain-containing protein, partial [Caldilineaceae bacterium]|nr:heparan-alpha-glucosaminide N-acetyltransferase domain-containing protein [Caldilineaceae bacterium]
YFPFPHWFAIFLIGVFVGTVFYEGGARKLPLPNLGGIFPFPVLQFLGRHSLVIYVIHQPMLIGLLLLTGTITLG